MMNASMSALVGFIAWTLVLLVLMEAMRVQLVFSKAVAANKFQPDNANLSPFMQRLARAHANCLEGLPIFGGLLVVALLMQKTGVTDPLAPWLLAARLLQSCIHILSTSVLAVNLRFTAFLVQLLIAIYWCWMLLLG